MPNFGLAFIHLFLYFFVRGGQVVVDGVEPRRKAGKRFARRKFFRLVKNVSVLSLCVLSLYYFSQSQFFALKRIDVRGLAKQNRDEVVRVSGLTLGMNYFRLDIQQAEERLRSLPLIEQVEVRKSFPNAVIIDIKEREPHALLCVNGGFWVIDRKGYCLERLSGTRGLPVITGLVPDSLTPGQRVSRKQLLQAVLAALDGEVQYYLSEINMNSEDNLIAYSRGGVPILLGTAERLPDKLRLSVSFIKTMGEAEKIDYIDIRAVEAPAVKYHDSEFKDGEKIFSVS